MRQILLIGFFILAACEFYDMATSQPRFSFNFSPPCVAAECSR